MKITKNHKKIFLSWLVLLVVSTGSIYALDSYYTGYRLENRSDMEVYYTSTARQYCKKVENNSSSNDYFVPTKTSSEWNYFNYYHPSNISISDCEPELMDCFDKYCSGYNHRIHFKGVTGECTATCTGSWWGDYRNFTSWCETDWEDLYQCSST